MDSEDELENFGSFMTDRRMDHERSSYEQSPRMSPQAKLRQTWADFNSNGRPLLSLSPPITHGGRHASGAMAGVGTLSTACHTYAEAATACKQLVRHIAKQCALNQQKFTDGDFDIQLDFQRFPPHQSGCLLSLELIYYRSLIEAMPKQRKEAVMDATNMITETDVLSGQMPVVDVEQAAFILRRQKFRKYPQSVHRVPWIFDDSSAQFACKGNDFGKDDILQGDIGNCWWSSSVATLSSCNALLQKICVAMDKAAGIYGFVFQRDGQWIWTVVDDNLYLRDPDFVNSVDNDIQYDPKGEHAKEYRRQKQSGSKSLLFGKCAREHSWLPLLEKAYAKIHGDYGMLHAGGMPGDAVEDLTGGVTTLLRTDRIINKNTLWAELKQANTRFVFGACTPFDLFGMPPANGLASTHVYGVVQVEHIKEGRETFDLVKLRNPWGSKNSRLGGSFNGPWNSGSEQWNDRWRERLKLDVNNNGEFWMTYDDFLTHFETVSRTRLLPEPRWTQKQRWTFVQAPWMEDFLPKPFSIRVGKAMLVVIALSQLDWRYFSGLQGAYRFSLEFFVRRHNANGTVDREFAPVHGRNPDDRPSRSVSVERELPAGEYRIFVRLHAFKGLLPPPETAIRMFLNNPIWERYHGKVRHVIRNRDAAFRRVQDSEHEANGRRTSNGGEMSSRNVIGEHSLSDLPSEDLAHSVRAREPQSPAQDTAAAPVSIGPEANDNHAEQHQASRQRQRPRRARSRELSRSESTSRMMKWDAWCGIGLRVYAQDQDFDVELLGDRHQDDRQEELTGTATEEREGTEREA